MPLFSARVYLWFRLPSTWENVKCSQSNHQDPFGCTVSPTRQNYLKHTRTHTYPLTLSNAHSLTHTHTHTHTRSITPQTHTHLLAHILSQRHTHTLSLSLSLTHTHTHLTHHHNYQHKCETEDASIPGGCVSSSCHETKMATLGESLGFVF